MNKLDKRINDWLLNRMERMDQRTIEKYQRYNQLSDEELLEKYHESQQKYQKRFNGFKASVFFVSLGVITMNGFRFLEHYLNPFVLLTLLAFIGLVGLVNMKNGWGIKRDYQVISMVMSSRELFKKVEKTSD